MSYNLKNDFSGDTIRQHALLASTLLLSTSLYATSYNYEVTPLIGLVFPEGNLHLKDQFLVGGELQINNLSDTIKTSSLQRPKLRL